LRQHLEVAQSFNSLGDALTRTSNYTESERDLRQALAIRRRMYGDEHQLVAESISNLGQNYGERGDFKQAEVYLRKAMKLQRKLLEEVHPDLAAALHNVGYAREARGRLSWCGSRLPGSAQDEPQDARGGYSRPSTSPQSGGWQ
jgi:Flp pilus assembly protein TadD